MKGTSFQKPFEFVLQIDGESWRQGDSVSGELIIKNRGGESADTSGARVQLALGELKKVRQKSPQAFKILATKANPAPAPLAPGNEASFAWRFETERNAPITDTGASLFLLYGKEESPEKLGQLQLVFQPALVIEEFLKELEINHRFVRKTQKAGKGTVEVKLDPPASRAFGTVEQLVLSFRFEGERLEVQYLFQVKKIEATAASFSTQAEKRDFRQSFEPNDYRVTSGRFNHERIGSAIGEVISQVESKILF